MPFTFRQAIPDDAAAIAKIFISDETSTFMQLYFGTVDPGVRHQGMTEILKEATQKPKQNWMVAVDDETGEVVSYSQWHLPRDALETVVEKTDEEKAKDTEDYRNKLLPGMNEPLVMDFREKLGILRAEALQGRRHYLLGNVGNLPWYRRKGAATALIRWPFEDADKDGVIVYLDTNQDGGARQIYERLGFERVGEAVFDLSKYGGAGTHTHIGMVREPQ